MKAHKFIAAALTASLALCPSAMAEKSDSKYICAYYVGDGSLMEAVTVDPADAESSPQDIICENAPDGADTGVLYQWDDTLRPQDLPVTVDLTKSADGSGAFLPPYVTAEMCRAEFWIENGGFPKT